MASKRFMSQAQIQAFLKFGPQEQALQGVRQDAIDSYGTTVKAARGTAQGVMGAIDTARPGVAALYDRALGNQTQRQALVNQSLVGLNKSADPVKAGSAVESGIFDKILGTTKTANLSDLTRQRIAAKSGESYAVQGAGRQLQADLAKVYTAKKQLADQKGAYTALAVQQLADAAAKQASQEAIARERIASNEKIARGHDATSAANAALRANGGKGKPMTAAQKKAAESTVGAVKNAAQAAKYLLGKGYSTTRVRQILEGLRPLQGGGSVNVNGKTGAVSVSSKAFNYGHEDVNTAMDLAINGRVSPANIRYLHRKNVILSKYGIPYKSGKVGRSTSGAKGVSSVGF